MIYNLRARKRQFFRKGWCACKQQNGGIFSFFRIPFFYPVFLFSLFIFPLGGDLQARLTSQIEGNLQRNYSQFLFLYSRTEAPGQSETYFHPFYSYYQNAETAYSFHSVLYPVFYSHGTNYWRKWTALYLFGGEDFYHVDTESDRDLLLSPLFLWGSGSTEKERYFSIFPLAGRIRNNIGQSEIRFFLFPLYSGWSNRDYEAHAILWPLTLSGNSPLRRDFRILPFYSSKVHRGKYNKKSILWPFVQWGSTGLDRRDPRHYLFLFPVYGRKWSNSGEMSATTILWPFSLVSWGRDEQRDAFDFRAFWFLYQYGYSNDPYIRKRIVFPFYGHYLTGTEERDYTKEFLFISPLYARQRTNSAVMYSEYHHFFPFYWSLRRYYRKERESSHYRKIWPLFSYSTASTGEYAFRSLSLWPLRSEHIDKVWGPYYSLFEMEYFENGDRFFSILFRSYSQYWSDAEMNRYFLGLETSHGPRHSSFHFLGGFLGLERETEFDGQTDTTLRFLWLSI